MATHSTTAEDRLAKLGIHLPDAPTPWRVRAGRSDGRLLFLSGMLATWATRLRKLASWAKTLTKGREAAYSRTQCLRSRRSS